MAIEKMVLLQIVGSEEEMHPIFKELIMSENVHLNFESSNIYNNKYLVHQYESNIKEINNFRHIDYDNVYNECISYIRILEELCGGLDIELKISKHYLSESESKYNFIDACKDLEKIKSSMGNKVDEIKNKKNEISDLLNFRDKVNYINNNIDFSQLDDLNYFDYEIGTLSSENKGRLKKNYENLSAIVLRIGIIKSSVEDLYIVIYLKQFKDEILNFLKSLSWNKLKEPEGIIGSTSDMIKKIDVKIEKLQNEINDLSNIIEMDKEENKFLLNKIYNTFILEEKISELEKNIDLGNNLFILSVWVQEKEKYNIEEAIGTVTNKFIVTDKSPKELGKQVKPPTKLKNNWFTKPFEMIIRMYGLPSYNEIDPTPFLAITYCLMFGIMFGDIGQGLVYFIAGYFLKRKMKVPGSILMRLGGSSMVFGFIYGSLFGLEQEELPWMPSLVGKVLDPRNIPAILLSGVIVGIVVLTISYIFGIINSLKVGDIENGIFGKNGAVGYLFFISLILTIVSLTKIINLPLIIPIISMLLSLVLMVLKQPLANFLLKKSKLFNDNPSSYFIESIFECIETVLSTLSNSISFIRVGAFALNHAGLFLAFLVMSELTDNIILKILILLLGNILILTLEGLIVFIQGLRLQYYEMFSKYFTGDGIEFKPVKLSR